VGDKGERVVDLVGDAGRRLPETGHLRLLKHPALRLLQVQVSLLKRGVSDLDVVERAAKVGGGSTQLDGPLLDLDPKLVVGLLQSRSSTLERLADPPRDPLADQADQKDRRGGQRR